MERYFKTRFRINYNANKQKSQYIYIILRWTVNKIGTSESNMSNHPLGNNVEKGVLFSLSSSTLSSSELSGRRSCLRTS